MSQLFAEGRRYVYRSAPLPPELRRVALDAARPAYEPDLLAASIGDLLRSPPKPDISHIRPTVSLERRLRVLRELLAARRVDFDESFGAEDRLTQAVTLFALLELHKRARRRGSRARVRGDTDESGRRDELARAESSRRCSFLSPEPVTHGRARRGMRATEAEIDRALDLLGTALAGARRGPARGRRRPHARRRPGAEDAARRLLARPKTPPLTQAQAETLAIVAYLQPVSRPEIARIRGVSSESAVQTLTERGLIEESGRSRFGAVIHRTTPLFERLFGLSGLDALPDPARFDPTPRGRGGAARALAQGRRAARRRASFG